MPEFRTREERYKWYLEQISYHAAMYEPDCEEDQEVWDLIELALRGLEKDDSR